MSTQPDTEEAAAYAGLIADICKLTTWPDHNQRRDLEALAFQRLGYETTVNKRGYCIRKAGESHWQTQPQILVDFGTAVRHTIGHRYGTLDHPLERNWYIQEMCEVGQVIDPAGGRIAAWAVRLGKTSKTSVEATAITPAAALVAAWLRTHP
jgi:hypothetical protein